MTQPRPPGLGTRWSPMRGHNPSSVPPRRLARVTLPRAKGLSFAPAQGPPSAQGVAGPPGAIAVEDGRTRVIITLKREFLRDGGHSLTLRFPRPSPATDPPVPRSGQRSPPVGVHPVGRGLLRGDPKHGVVWAGRGFLEQDGGSQFGAGGAGGVERRKSGARCGMKAPASSCRLLVTSRVPSAGSRPGGGQCPPPAFLRSARNQPGTFPRGFPAWAHSTAAQVVPGGPRGAGPAAAAGESVPARGESPGKELIKSSLRFLAGNNFLRRCRLPPRDGPLMQPGGLCVCCRFYPPAWCWKKPPKMRCWVGFCSGSRGGWEKVELLKPKLPDQRPPGSLGVPGVL